MSDFIINFSSFMRKFKIIYWVNFFTVWSWILHLYSVQNLVTWVYYTPLQTKFRRDIGFVMYVCTYVTLSLLALFFSQQKLIKLDTRLNHGDILNSFVWQTQFDKIIAQYYANIHWKEMSITFDAFFYVSAFPVFTKLTQAYFTPWT